MGKKYYVVKGTTTSTLNDRYIVKGFQTSHAMHKFLNNQRISVGSQYVEHTTDGVFRDVPQKAGTYVFLGGQYKNVRNLSAVELAHV